MTTARIMIVEDEGLVADDLTACIRGFGYEVVGVADTVAAARQLAEATKPDLALLDIQLKGEADGIHLAHDLRKQQIGFVYLTAHSDTRTLERAQVTEPLGYVLKPFGARDMLPVLQTALYRHTSEKQLRSMERWLSTTLRSIGDGVLVTDLEGRVTFANRVAENILGMTRHEIVGREFADVLQLLEPDGTTADIDVAARAIRQKATVVIEPGTDLQRRDGTRIGIDDCAAPVFADDGLVTGAVVVFRDVTERRGVERKRREADMRMLEAEKMESIAVLASGLAHDLGNVLMAILGNVALCRHAGTDGTEQPLREVESGARAAVELCRRMLTGVGSAPLVATPVEIGPVLDQCARRERALAGDSVEFHVRLEHPDLRVQGDELQLKQVVANLLRNAAEAVAGRRGHVVLRAGALRLPNRFLHDEGTTADLAPGDYVWIEVNDDGPGIPADVKARLFEPRFTTKATGHGLGLANVHAIVRRHHGSITVESEPGLGSLFRIFLPAAPDPAGTPPEGSSTENHTGTILVVDDDSVVRQVTARLLATRKWRCVEADSGAAALDLLASGVKVDGLVLDMQMPGRSGAETLREIRKTRPTLPVVLVSGLGTTPPDEDDPYTTCLTKPFLVEELLAALRRVRG